MGAAVSHMNKMELRREEGARAEPYNMLLESESTLRSQRALKRELCFTRAAVLVLALLLGLCVCLMFFVQFPACKGIEHDGKRNGDHYQAVQAQTSSYDSYTRQRLSTSVKGNQKDDQDDDSQPKQPFTASLIVNCSAISSTNNGNITWIDLGKAGFTLPDRQSLVVPEKGEYRISLQITYRNTETKKKNLVLSHKVVVYQQSYPEPQTVLAVYESVSGENFTWFKTKYSQDVFKLDQGDIIRVESRNLTFISCITGASFLSVRQEPTG